MSAFEHKIFAQIEPVFVLGSAELNGPAEYTAGWMQEFEENMRIHLEKVLLTPGFPHVLSPKILVEPLAATSAAVEALLEYATKRDADLIIVSSHGRRGLDRFFLGSFAETLLVYSKIPILVIGAGAKIETNFNRILFPTEFGEYAHEVFRRTVSAAKQMGASIIIYHVVPMPARIVMDTGYYPSLYGVEGEMVSREDFLKIQQEHQSLRAEAWADWAKGEGVNCSFKVESVEEAIDILIYREAVAERADLIMMEGQSGPIKVALLGSIARNVVRTGPCPVLVFPRNALAETEKEGEMLGYEERTPEVSDGLGLADKSSELRDFEV
ncbi:MAG TPA: universal stress protein [Pseudobdellovibrionaceae bacterium]